MIFYQILFIDHMGEFAHGYCGLKGLIKAFLGIMFFLFYLLLASKCDFFLLGGYCYLSQ